MSKGKGGAGGQGNERTGEKMVGRFALGRGGARGRAETALPDLMSGSRDVYVDDLSWRIISSSK